MLRKSLWAALIALMALLSGCSFFGVPDEPLPPVEIQPAQALQEVNWQDLPMTKPKRADLRAWAEALKQSYHYYKSQPAAKKVRFGRYYTTNAKMAEFTLELAENAAHTSPYGFARWVYKNVTPFRAVGHDGQGSVLFTAYYEPLLLGSKTPTERFRYPLYKRPPELITLRLQDFRTDLPNVMLRGQRKGDQLVPFHDRQAIEQRNVLRDKALELVWVDDPVGHFFLQVQGSGRVKLPDGSLMRVGYADANGHPYRSIGKLLIEEGRVPKEEMSLPVLRQWLAAHPDEMQRVMHHNPSYVFFKEIKGGPYGNIGVPLTAGRSIATDYRLFPRGAPAMIRTELPVFSGEGPPSGWEKEVRLVANQDTGGAIRGAGRVDLFTGFGPDAERTAGEMKQDGGALYFFAPKNMALWPEGQQD
ncbi:MltA domain protein [Magnetococcus marinus MC-1]|uniref:peptidoglycan lytic exotransglycosylase n=1 Tax=Magnetococcus marinus (strain ATCC BAA-1437 / JCM 17883 / MC-1) TaxID=156889 RepID=A0L4W6_MAGMM|nr:MltA domain-containing protein [Magnetococcus marinus]ABK43009.1 MltA domain protein [Magnetococcus marinus MC-1]